jgi:hypothetical protein
MHAQTFIRLLGAAALLSVTSMAQADSVTPDQIVQIGDFTRSNRGTMIGPGVDVYSVDCDERSSSCSDNQGHEWAFGDDLSNVWIHLCSEELFARRNDCVKLIEVSVTTAQPYGYVHIDLQRAGSEVNQAVFDNEKGLGVGGAVPAGLVDPMTETAGDEGGRFVDTFLYVGRVTPQRTHRLVIRSVGCSPGVRCDGKNAVTGIRIRGVKVSHRDK